MLDETDNLKKAAFAKLFLKERDAFKVALVLFPEDTSKALWAATHWPGDLEVMEHEAAEKEASGVSDDEIYVEEQLKAIIEGFALAGDKVRAIEKYMDLKGLSKKAVAGPSVQVIVPRVMEVVNHGSDADWEQIAIKQQTDLLNVSRTRH